MSIFAAENPQKERANLLPIDPLVSLGFFLVLPRGSGSFVVGAAAAPSPASSGRARARSGARRAFSGGARARGAFLAVFMAVLRLFLGFRRHFVCPQSDLKIFRIFLFFLSIFSENAKRRKIVSKYTKRLLP